MQFIFQYASGLFTVLDMICDTRFLREEFEVVMEGFVSMDIAFIFYRSSTVEATILEWKRDQVESIVLSYFSATSDTTHSHLDTLLFLKSVRLPSFYTTIIFHPSRSPSAAGSRGSSSGVYRHRDIKRWLLK